MPTVVALTDASVPSLPRGWNAAVRIFEADGTTLATIYRDANGDDTGVNPLPQAKGSEFGIAGTGSWTVYVTAGTYVVSVTPHGGSAHTQTVVVATPAVPEAGTELGTVWGTPSDGQVPLWNATAGRFEWGDAGGSASSGAADLGSLAIRATGADGGQQGAIATIDARGNTPSVALVAAGISGGGWIGGAIYQGPGISIDGAQVKVWRLVDTTGTPDGSLIGTLSTAPAQTLADGDTMVIGVAAADWTATDDLDFDPDNWDDESLILAADALPRLYLVQIQLTLPA